MDDRSEKEVLLNLNGYRHYNRDDGYWIKIEAWETEITDARPHGLRYSLSLHDANGTRVIGFDNAHGIKVGNKRRYSARKIVYDHEHRLNKVMPYDFRSSARLLEDFWKAVSRIVEIK